MEYLEIGDLFTYLHQNPPLPETEAKDIAYQILDGLGMMHQNSFAHRDLKPQVSLLFLHRDNKYISLRIFLEHPHQITSSTQVVDQARRLRYHQTHRGRPRTINDDKGYPEILCP
jgi:serine/threonine protein kinase